MNLFLDGAVTIACMAVGVFFLKFWKNTHDRLFGMFALAFWLLALDRIVVFVMNNQSTGRSPSAYLLRLAAFVVIIVAIVEKNRKSNYPR